MSEETTLEGLYADLYAKIEEVLALKAALPEVEVAMLATEEGRAFASVKGAIAQAKAEAEGLEQRLRDLACQVHRQTRTTHPHPQVEIQKKRHVLFRDEDALAWAIDHMRQALALDRRLVAQHALAVEKTAPLDFVTIDVEWTPVIRGLPNGKGRGNGGNGGENGGNSDG